MTDHIADTRLIGVTRRTRRDLGRNQRHGRALVFRQRHRQRQTERDKVRSIERQPQRTADVTVEL